MTLKVFARYAFWSMLLGLIVLAVLWIYPFGAKEITEAEPQQIVIYRSDEQQNIDIYKSKGPAVVNITSITMQYDFFYRTQPAAGAGSGFIVDPRGFVLTNFHVVENARELTVTLADNTQLEAEVSGTDPNNDLALVKINNPPEDLSILELGDSSQLLVGQKVLALGNPFGLTQTLTTGIISALGRTIQTRNGRKIDRVIQSDAAINPGNSGGPLLNSIGEVIGINTAIIGSSGSVGIGFAVPSNTIKKVLPDLIAHGYVRRPWLGVETLETHRLRSLGVNIEKGMLIVNTIPNSPAETAGLRGATRRVRVRNYVIPWGGDIIVAIDNKTVETLEELADTIESYQLDEEVEIQFIRGERERTVRVRLAQRPRPQSTRTPS